MELTAINVNAIFTECLFRNDSKIKKPLEVEGIRMNVGFHRGKLQKCKKNIVDLCSQVSDMFRRSVGGGGSFLNFCVDKDEQLWTGEHQTCEKLLMLGLAVGIIEFLAPRELWSIFPGGMPYMVVNDAKVVSEHND